VDLTDKPLNKGNPEKGRLLNRKYKTGRWSGC